MKISYKVNQQVFSTYQQHAASYTSRYLATACVGVDMETLYTSGTFKDILADPVGISKEVYTRTWELVRLPVPAQLNPQPTPLRICLPGRC